MADFNRAPIAHEPISVVLVSQGESNQESEAVAAWTKVLSDGNRDHELILVRQGDAPITADGFLGQSFPTGCTFGLFSGSSGYGASLRAGVSLARHPLLFYTSCDGQFQPADFGKLLQAVDQVDVVTGCRVAGPVPAWFGLGDLLRRWIMRVVFGMEVPKRDTWLGWPGWTRRWVARWLFGVAVQDPECGFRLFRRELFRRILIQSDSDFANVEILAKANFLGALISEIPVTWNRPLAVSKPRRKGEVYRLFTNPDFGPSLLDQPPTASVV